MEIQNSIIKFETDYDRSMHESMTDFNLRWGGGCSLYSIQQSQEKKQPLPRPQYSGTELTL